MVHRLTFVNKLNSALEFYSYWIWCEWNVHWMWCIHQQKQLFLNINSNHIRLRLRFRCPSLSFFLFVVVDVRDVIVFVWFCFNINMTFCWHYSFCIVCLSSVHYSKLSICVTDCIVLYCIVLNCIRFMSDADVTWTIDWFVQMMAFLIKDIRFFYSVANFNGYQLKKWVAKKSVQPMENVHNTS